MAKFKKVPDRYDIVDNCIADAMSKGESPSSYLEGRIKIDGWFLKELKQRKKADKSDTGNFDEAIKHTEEQILITKAKLEDIQYGTNNFGLFRLEREIEELEKELPYAGVGRKTFINGRIKRLKQKAQLIRLNNNEIRRQMHILGFDKPKMPEKNSHLVDEQGNQIKM